MIAAIEREPLDSDGCWPSWPHPDAPDHAWEDASNGDAVCAHCGGRGRGSPSQQVAPLESIIHAADCDRPEGKS